MDQKTCKLSLKDVKNGVYTVSAVALNKNGDRLGKESNKVKITVKCLSHAYSSKITKQPTQTKAGVKTLVCSECGAKKQEAIPSLSSTSFKNTAVSSLKVTSAAKDRAVIKWSKVKNANGYAVYQTIGGKWKMIKTLDGKTTSYTVKDLKPGQTYKLRVRAFIKSGDAKVYSKAKDITAATKPAEPKFTKVSRPAKGAVTLTWSKAAGADSYIIYTSPTAKGDYKKLATVDGGKTSVKLTGLKRSRYAYFKIKAVNKASNTAYSSAERTAYAFVL